MGELPTIDEGESVTLTVTKHDGEFIVDESAENYSIRFLEEPPVDEGAQNEVTATISKTIYTPSGALETLFLSADSPPASTSSDTKSATESSSSSQSGGSPSGSSERSDPSSTERDSLQEIAEDLIGDEDLQVTADDESVLSKARKRAKKQGRDPAVDPKYNQS